MADGDCVIVVEPAEADFRLIQECLSHDGVEVQPASSLLEAVLYEVTARDPVILYDMDAPEHWREALEQFLRLRPKSRVVFLSRLADTPMWLEVLDTGGYDLVMKPFREEDIRWVVHKALRPARGQAA